MNYIVTPYVYLSALSGSVTALLTVLIWRRRQALGASSALALMMAILIWSVGATIEHASVSVPAKIRWSQVQYIGTLSAPVFLLLLALAYNRLEHWLTWQTVLTLLVIPCFTLVLAWTNHLHGLIWPAVTRLEPPEANLVQYSYGWAFWVFVVGYSYLIIAVATGLFIRSFFVLPTTFHWQVGLLVTVTTIVWVVDMMYVFGYSPVPGLELTPLVMILTGMIGVWMILRWRMFDLVPLARKMLIDTIPDGMLVLDAQDRIVTFNPAAQHQLGGTVPLQVGQPVAEVFAHSLDWSALRREREQTRLEFFLPGAGQNEMRSFDMHISTIYNWRKQMCGYLLLMRDITAYTRAQVAVEQQTSAKLQALVELDHLRTELIGNVSHDLRTPLGLIKIASTTLQREDVQFTPDIQAQILQQITIEADRLERLVARMLDMSQLGQTHVVLNKQLVDLNHFLTRLTDSFRHSMQIDAKRLHTLVTVLPETPVGAVIDEIRMKQAIRNLLENAVHYSPCGGEVSVLLRQNDQGWCLEIADQGIGIADEEMSHIFERFYRSRDPRVQRYRGVGLGLPICKKIVEAHDGRMIVTSTLDGGTTFCLCFPAEHQQGKTMLLPDR